MDRTDGGIYISHDGGTTWTLFQRHGWQVRAGALAGSSDPKILVAGAITGVYRSEDSGAALDADQPRGSGEILKVESVAIDPVDPKTIYAGTWHLPWKTTDGGATWHNIKQGLIDDSDVFSIIIDPTRPAWFMPAPAPAFIAARTAGELFRKVQGIPSTARRTRVLMQDP